MDYNEKRGIEVQSQQKPRSAAVRPLHGLHLRAFDGLSDDFRSRVNDRFN